MQHGAIQDAVVKKLIQIQDQRSAPARSEGAQSLNSSPANPGEIKASSKTLGDLISEHIPEHLQADVLALMHEKLVVEKGLDGENSPSSPGQ